MVPSLMSNGFIVVYIRDYTYMHIVCTEIMNIMVIKSMSII